jgi:hypothetical protein
MAARLCKRCDALIPSGSVCEPCRHKQRRRHTPTPAGSVATLVWGPPCAGKNTYVEQHRKSGDMVVDFDAIIAALGGAGGHDQPEALRPFTFDCLDAVMARLASGNHILERAWVIMSAPARVDRDPFRAGRLVGLVPDIEVCKARAERERPTEWLEYIDNWFAKYEPEA